MWSFGALVGAASPTEEIRLFVYDPVDARNLA